MITFEPYHIYRELMGNGWLQFGLSLFHMSVAGVIVARGIRQGVERAIGVVMSVFIVLVLILITQSLRLPGAGDALRFLFYPDFSGFKVTSWTHVIGHVCFTLSLGIGAMIVFGSYFSEELHTPTEAVRVASLDTVMSLLAGLLIFPIVFTTGAFAEGGPGLLFQSLPVLFQRIGMGPLFGAMFFLCLYCAALGATIGLLEAGVSSLVDRKKLSRKKSTRIVCALVVVGSLFPALGTTVFRSVQYQGMGLLELLDSLIISWMLPLSSLGVCLVVGYRLDRRVMAREFMSFESQGLARLYRNWLFVLRWVAPAVILTALLLNIIGALK
jgi:NSS family neurotransmitter:Na+ symporter